jgi:hypothetical protein
MTAGHAPRDTMIRDLVLLLGLPGLLTVLLLMWWRPWRPPYEARSVEDVFAVASGTWDWSEAEGFCAANPHTITFSDDRQLMTITPLVPWTDSTGVEQGAAVYDIHESTRGRIRGQIRGETRLTKVGEPVVWDLVLFSADEYRWHRTDWPPGSYTNKVVRCPTDSSTVSDLS